MTFLVSHCCFPVLDKKNSTESINHEGEEHEVRQCLALFAPGLLSLANDFCLSNVLLNVV